MGMSHVVEPARFADGGLHCGFPEAGAEAGATQRSACGCGEDQAIVAGVGGDVLGEDVTSHMGIETVRRAARVLVSP